MKKLPKSVSQTKKDEKQNENSVKKGKNIRLFYSLFEFLHSPSFSSYYFMF